jgi:hypothetical protein
VINLLCGFTDLLENNVLLLYSIDKMGIDINMFDHGYDIVCIITPESVDKFIELLRYKSNNKIKLCIVTDVSTKLLTHIASNDFMSKITDFYELYLNYHVIEPFVFNIKDQSHLKYVLLSAKLYPSNLTLLTSMQTLNESLKLHQYRSRDNEYLLCYNRYDDPITPLLINWNYVSLLHEVFEITNNIIKHDNKEIIVSSREDSFYKSNMFSIYDKLSANTIQKSDECKAEIIRLNNLLKSSKIDDLKDVAASLQKFKKMLANIEKHLYLQEKLSNNIETMINESIKEQTLITEGKYDKIDTIKLKILYYLKFKKHHSLDPNDQLTQTQIQNLDCILKTWNQKINKKSNWTKIDMYEPLLVQYLTKITKTKLYNKIIVFIDGGMTWEEAKIVNEFIKSNPGLSIIIGSTHMLNTKTFINGLI